MRTRDADSSEKAYEGTVEASSVLNAVGQACIRFGVRTDAIFALSVEEEPGRVGDS